MLTENLILLQPVETDCKTSCESSQQVLYKEISADLKN